MNSTSAFTQVDHPLLIIGEMIYCIGLFILFMLVRKRPRPMPQLVAITAFSVLINLGGRVSKGFWFTSSDIIMFWSLAVMNSVWVLSVIRQKLASTGAGDETGKSALLTSDLFEKKEYRVVYGFAGVALAILLYSYLSTYQDKVFATMSQATAYVQGYTKAVKEQKKQDQMAQESRDSIAAALLEKDIKDSLWRDYVRADRDKQLLAIQGLSKEVKKNKVYVKPVLSRPLIIVAPAPKGLSNSNFTLPEIKTFPVDVKPRRRGRGVGYDYDLENVDTTRYAKNFQ